MPSKTSRRARTGDRAPPGVIRPALYTIGKIGDKRKLLPNGSLLCEDVPIARTGVQLYHATEIPLKPSSRPGASPAIAVTRDRETLFAPEALGSIVGCAITLDHPPQDVTPQNWHMLAKGFVLDAWQGDVDGDLMFADLIITDKGLIHKVNVEGLREVSAGYDAHYEQTGDGEGRQRNIVFNHLALVTKGRCGPRCAIGDRQPDEEFNMPQANGTGGSRPRVRLNDTVAALRAQADALEQDGDGDDDGVHVHVHMGGERTTDGDGASDDGGGDNVRTIDAQLEERFSTIEDGMLELRDAQTGQNELLAAIAAKVGVTPPSAKTGDGDSVALQTSFTQFTSQAEILVPGYKAPTFDSALPRAKTVDAMCAGRRAVLTLVAATTDGAQLLKDVTGDDAAFDIAASPCDMVATVFKSAATVKAATNNRSMTGDKMGVPIVPANQSVASGGGMKMRTADEINAANAKYWAEHNRSA